MAPQHPGTSAPAWAALVFDRAVWVGPIAGWNEHGPVIAWLEEDGRFRGYVEPQASTRSWVGADPAGLRTTALVDGMRDTIGEPARQPVRRSWFTWPGTGR